MFFSTPHLLKPPEGTPQHGGARVKNEALPPCSNCGSKDVAVEKATIKAEYTRCQECGAIQDDPILTGQSDVIAAINATVLDAGWQTSDGAEHTASKKHTITPTVDPRACRTFAATDRHAPRGPTAGAPTLRAAGEYTRELMNRVP